MLVLPVDNVLLRAFDVVQDCLNLLLDLVQQVAFMIRVFLFATRSFCDVVLHAHFFRALLEVTFYQLPGWLVAGRVTRERPYWSISRRVAARYAAKILLDVRVGDVEGLRLCCSTAYCTRSATLLILPLALHRERGESIRVGVRIRIEAS